MSRPDAPLTKFCLDISDFGGEGDEDNDDESFLFSRASAAKLLQDNRQTIVELNIPMDAKEKKLLAARRADYPKLQRWSLDRLDGDQRIKTSRMEYELAVAEGPRVTETREEYDNRVHVLKLTMEIHMLRTGAF